ncbi:MAG: hemolysin family protein [Propionibacteriaceae bacterium]|jgi:putative hemolysin|nr:hemolysin family protein [Propionibacteriaceae bacterium]
MGDVWFDILLVFVFFLIGAVFSAAEMALIGLRDSQIKVLSRKGRRGRAIVELTRNPNRFLSAVQIGVTLCGFLSASFGAATLVDGWVTPWLVSLGMPAKVSGFLSLFVVTAVISFGSIVISELTAKRLAMQRPEAFALALAPLINNIARLFRPLIWALGVCTNGLVRLLGGDPKAGKESVSDDELRSMVTSSATLGAEERHIVDEVFDAGDHSLREVMIPRTEVDFLTGDTPAYKAAREVTGGAHSRYPVAGDSPDDILGFVHVRDLMELAGSMRQVPIRQLVRPVLNLPGTVKVLRALTLLRRQRAHLAIVLDEYGGTAGIVTLEDLVEELIGDITDEYDEQPDATLRRGSDEYSGLTTLEEFTEVSGILLPEGPYDTLAGFFMAKLGSVPQLGDVVSVVLAHAGENQDAETLPPEQVEMQVIEMDSRRVAWLRVTETATAE